MLDNLILDYIVYLTQKINMTGIKDTFFFRACIKPIPNPIVIVLLYPLLLPLLSLTCDKSHHYHNC